MEASSKRAELALTHLSLTDFRCYGHADLALDGRPVVLVGPNGAGKTAVLEAVSLLSPGRGLRGAKVTEFSRKAPGEAEAARDWAVAGTIRQVTDGVMDETRIGTGTQGTSRRVVRVNGAAAGSANDLASYLRIAWLTPAMDRLFLEGASGRRRFFDRLVLGAFPGHARESVQYEQAVRERTRLLKAGSVDPAWATALESRMAAHGLVLARNRALFARDLRRAIEAAPESPFPKAQVALEGALEARVLDEDEAALRAEFEQALKAMRPRDAAAGRALKGPHRTDLTVVHGVKQAPARDCSTGEQKALLVGMILANARLRMEEDGRPPLLLLDEIAAHLDEARRSALFDQICDMGMQSFMTGTDLSLFEALKSRAQLVEVAQATLSSGSDCPPSR